MASSATILARHRMNKTLFSQLLGNPIFDDPRSFNFAGAKIRKIVQQNLPPMRSELHVEICLIRSERFGRDFYAIKANGEADVFVETFIFEKIKMTKNPAKAARFNTIDEAFELAVKTFRLVKPIDTL